MNSAKNRILQFWEWFEKNYFQVESYIDQKDFAKATDMISCQFREIGFPEQLCIGYNDKTKKYEMVFYSGDDKTVRYVSRAWREAAPDTLCKTWDFLSFKPAAEKHCSFEVDKKKYSIKGFFVWYRIDDENQKLDVEVFCKAFRKMSCTESKNIAVLLLQTFLGEKFTEQRIGSIKTVTKHSGTGGKRYCFAKFAEIALMGEKIFEWKPLADSNDIWSTYEIQSEPDETVPRGDILFGITANPGLIHCRQQQIECAERLGCSYCWISMPVGNRCPRQFLHYRAEVEKKLRNFLQLRSLGYIAGGATGVKNMYLDMLVLDDAELAVCLSDIRGFADCEIKFGIMGAGNEKR